MSESVGACSFPAEFFECRVTVDGRADPAQADYMTRDALLYPFDLVATELRTVGITLTRLPGEYRVKYDNGGDSAERVAETLDGRRRPKSPTGQ
jgi:hypothetical protein